jgi:hypothetical protein
VESESLRCLVLCGSSSIRFMCGLCHRLPHACRRWQIWKRHAFYVGDAVGVCGCLLQALFVWGDRALVHSVPVGVRSRVCARVRWHHGLGMMAIASVLDDHRSCRNCGCIGGPGWEGILAQIGRTEWIAPTPQTTAAAASGLKMTETTTARI